PGDGVSRLVERAAASRPAAEARARSHAVRRVSLLPRPDRGEDLSRDQQRARDGAHRRRAGAVGRRRLGEGGAALRRPVRRGAAGDGPRRSRTPDRPHAETPVATAPGTGRPVPGGPGPPTAGPRRSAIVRGNGATVAVSSREGAASCRTPSHLPTTTSSP